MAKWITYRTITTIHIIYYYHDGFSIRARQDHSFTVRSTGIVIRITRVVCTTDACGSIIIFTNKTLDDITVRLPQTKTDLVACYGIKEKKYQSFGSAILAITRQYIAYATRDD